MRSAAAWTTRYHRQPSRTNPFWLNTLSARGKSHFNRRTVKVTTSIGVAASDGRGLENPEALVSAADEAMYVSKWTTKNRVTTWPPSDKDSELARDSRARAKKEKKKNPGALGVFESA